MFAIVTAATKGYLFAWKECVQKALLALPKFGGIWFFVTDLSPEGEEAFDYLKTELPSYWKAEKVILDIPDDTSPNYKIPAQIRIARLQGAGFQKARQLDCEYCLSLESDVLVRPDCIEILKWVLSMPSVTGKPYYDIAMATYPNGLFLGGRGSPTNPIAEDFLPKERVIPEELQKRMDDHEEISNELFKLKVRIPEEFMVSGAEIMKEVKQCPPSGSIWELIAKHGWRQRGWLDFAYPAVGIGSVLPTDWVGLGCTLMSKTALQLADFLGYDGKGTQDLFLCWKRWHPSGLKMAVVPHTPCDHVKPERDSKGNRTGALTHYHAYHEQVGESIGHLRCRASEYVSL